MKTAFTTLALLVALTLISRDRSNRPVCLAMIIRRLARA